MADFKIEGDDLILTTDDGTPYEFRPMGHIEPLKNEGGSVFTDQPQFRYKNTRGRAYNPNCNDTTEFTRFRVEGLPKDSGVYVWLLDGEKTLSYIGRAKNLNERFSSKGYDRISPRNCFVGGQSTNCKMNHEVLKQYQDGKRFRLYILETKDFVAVEAALLNAYNTRLNKQLNN